MWVMRYLVRGLAALLTVVITPGVTSISPGVPLSAQSPAGVSAAAQAEVYDVIIRNGRVLDGSGNPWVRGDVAIRGARIAAVGRLADAKATTIIDAGNRFVTPGFIDVHSHAAEGLSRAELRQARPIVAQGVTTIVVNPDGGGPVDLAAQRAALSKGGVGPNVALLVGHGSVRGAVMETDPNRAPTSDELTQMKALVRTGMEQGAFGLSSGLFYTPGSYSKTDEVVALAAVAGEFGGVYTSHIRDEGDYNVGVVAAVQEVIRIAEEGRLTGIVSHMKALGPDNWGLSMASTQRIAQARARGIPVFADQYPYEASSTSLRAALLPGGVELPKPRRDVRRSHSRRANSAARSRTCCARTSGGGAARRRSRSHRMRPTAAWKASGSTRLRAIVRRRRKRRRSTCWCSATRRSFPSTCPTPTSATS